MKIQRAVFVRDFHATLTLESAGQTAHSVMSDKHVQAENIVDEACAVLRREFELLVHGWKSEKQERIAADPLLEELQTKLKILETELQNLGYSEETINDAYRRGGPVKM